MLTTNHRARRELLTTLANPASSRDYVVTLASRLGTGTLSLRYVPDHLILETGALAHYLKAIQTLPWTSLEHQVTAIAEDINDGLVARWMHLLVTVPIAESTGMTHEVLVEDRQPQWDNRKLLSRLRRY